MKEVVGSPVLIAHVAQWRNTVKFINCQVQMFRQGCWAAVIWMTKPRKIIPVQILIVASKCRYAVIHLRSRSKITQRPDLICDSFAALLETLIIARSKASEMLVQETHKDVPTKADGKEGSMSTKFREIHGFFLGL